MSIKIPIETSARHLHISQEDFEKLFGAESESNTKSENNAESENSTEADADTSSGKVNLQK